MLTWFVGTSGWYGWYVALWFGVAALGLTAWWLREQTPGAGPQGGEAAMLVFFLGLLILTVTGFVFALRLGGVLAGSWLRRYGAGLGGWLLAWGTVVNRLFVWANAATLSSTPPAERARAMVGFVALTLLAAAGQLWMMARVRQG